MSQSIKRTLFEKLKTERTQSSAVKQVHEPIVATTSREFTGRSCLQRQDPAPAKIRMYSRRVRGREKQRSRGASPRYRPSEASYHSSRFRMQSAQFQQRREALA